MEEDTSKKVEVDKKTSKGRCRTKKLLNLIQKQLDFYFSDVNLNHDRFLRKAIEESTDGYVDLSTMLKCNKLKQLTSDTTILAKAVGNSASLELSEDRLKVRRKTKLHELQNTDSRTVYVEEFPLNIDHDWLKLVFSTCGAVEYISLPKFKHNNQVKGFAFIEFAAPNEAQKACQVLNTIQCKNKKRLSTEGRNNEDGSAKKKNNRKRRSNSECDNNSSTNQHNTKRRRSVSESSEGSPAKMNKRKRRSSFCSIKEAGTDNVEKLEKTVSINTKCDNVLSTPTKKRRSKDASVSSEEENKYVKIKSNGATTIIQKTNINLSTAVHTPALLATKTTTISRKRKISDEKENEINKEKILKEPKCNKDVKPSATTQDKVSDSQDKVSDSQDKVSDSPDKVSDSPDKVGDSQDKVGDSQDNVGDSQDKVGDSQDKVGDSPDKVGDSPDKVGDSLDTVGDSLDTVGDSQDKVGDSQDKVGDSQDKVGDSSDKVGDSSDKVGKVDCSDKTPSEKVIENLQTDSHSGDAKSKEHKRKVNPTSDKEYESSEKKIKLDETSLHKEITTKGSTEPLKETVSESNVKKEEGTKKKKNRQHKKKGEKVSNEISVPPLHVIPKSEWLTLKKEYKRLQRIQMSELKKNLKVLKIEKVRRTELKERIFKSIAAKNQKEETESTKENIDEEKKADVDEEKENYSKITSTVESEKVNSVKGVDTKSTGLKVVSGTVVALKTSSENLTRKDIKSTLSTFGQVAYVDYVDGVYQGFVRFVSTDDVDKVMSVSSTDKQSWVFQLRKLSNEEEKEYFQKAEEDRLKKYDKDQRKKRKKVRGIDKITRDVEEVSNHVHFT